MIIVIEKTKNHEIPNHGNGFTDAYQMRRSCFGGLRAKCGVDDEYILIIKHGVNVTKKERS